MNMISHLLDSVIDEYWKNKMNQFQKNVMNNFPLITIDNFLYFTGELEKKIKKMELPKSECSINNVFIDATDMRYYRRQYCLLNCGLKCLSVTNKGKIKWII